jgi:DNA-binding CsgD family transcriptional regulator/tetratricopeptide (TPR) repeat protein
MRRPDRSHPHWLLSRTNDVFVHASGSDVQRPGVETAVADLTAREREIAELASSGLTSSEIGRRLSVSRRTVDSHLGRVYAKLSVANRTALAAVMLAARHGDVATPAAAGVDGGGVPVRPSASALEDGFDIEPGAGIKAGIVRLPRADHAVQARTAPTSVVPAQLPAGVPTLVGRTEQLRRLDDLLGSAADDGPVVCAVTGTAGVGKTTLAVHWAHRVADRFPDGLLYVDLRGFHPSIAPVAPGEAIRDCLIALDVATDRIPSGPQTLAALYRTTLAGRRVLVLLDNAHNADQVRPLLPGSASALAVVTSRDRLTSLLAGGAHHISVDLPTTDEAVSLLTARVGRRRVAEEPVAAHRIIDRCGRLPLAITLAAARLVTHPTFSLASLADELEHTHHGLDVLTGDDATTDVRAVLASSYLHLGESPARLFRLLGLHPGSDIAAPAAAALMDTPPARARATLSALERGNLITEHSPGRFTMHELLRRYARELAHAIDPEHERQSAHIRLTDHHVALAHRASDLIGAHRPTCHRTQPRPDSTADSLGSPAEALRWYDAERPVFLASARHAIPGDRIIELACALAELYNTRGHWHDWAAIAERALTVAVRRRDVAAQACLHRGRARAAVWLNDPDTARSHLRQAIERYNEMGDLIGLAHTTRTVCWFLGRQGEHRAAADHAHRAVNLHRRAGDRAGQGQSLNSLGWQHAHLGNYDLAVRYCIEAVRLLDETGDHRGKGYALDSLGYVEHLRGNRARALDHYRQAVHLFRQTGDRYNEADTLIRIGDTHREDGDLAEAGAVWRRADEILTELSHPDAQRARARLDPDPVGAENVGRIG